MTMSSRMLIFFTVLLSCCQSQDNGKMIVRHEMVNCILILTSRQLNLNSDLQTTANAVYCLEAITGIKSQIIHGSDMPFFYPSDERDFVEYFYDDVVKWSNWIEKNADTISENEANNLLTKFSKNVGFELKWPPRYTQLMSEGKITNDCCH